MSEYKKISVMARGQKRLYTGFIVVIIVLFVLTSIYTNFNPVILRV